MARGTSLLRHALPILAVIVAGCWSLATMRFQTELLPLFPQQLDAVRTLRQAQTQVVSEREVIAVAKPGTNPGWVMMAKLAGALAGKPGIGSAEVGLGTNHSPAIWMATLAAGLPSDRFRTFSQSLKPQAAGDRLRETLDEMSGAIDEKEMGRLRFDPLQMESLLFPDPAHDPLAAGLSVPPVLSIASATPLRTFSDDQKFVAEVKAALAAATRELHLSPAPVFLLTGQPAFTADISRQMKRDLIVMLTFTVVLISLAFWCAYRSLVPLAWIIAAQLLALLCAATAGRLIFGELNVMSIGFSSILLGVGMDYCILVYHFFAQPGVVDRKKWHELRHAIWLSSATTAATFGILYFSSFPGLQQLAVLVGIGLLATAFFATTLLADLLELHRPHAPGWLVVASDRYARFISRYRLPLRLAALGIFIGAALLPAGDHRLYDASIEQLQPTQIEAFEAQQILEKAMGPAVTTMQVGGDAEANRRAWVPVNVATIREEFEKAGFDATWSTTTLQTLEALNQWHAGQLDLTGPGQAEQAWIQLRSELNQTAVSDFKHLSLFMLATVILLCAVAHRSFRLVMLNMAALVLAMLLLKVLLIVTDNSLTLVSLLCLPLMIGLVIDYSLHIVMALEHEHGNLVEAFRHLAAPVVLTGLASIIGFTAPMLSSQPALQNFGNVMDLGTLAAVASGLVLLPALYIGLKPVHLETDSKPHSVALYRASMFSCGTWLAGVLPLNATRGLAGALGRLYAITHPGRVTVVEKNLRLIKPDVRRVEAQQVYAEFGKTLADYFHLTTRPPDQSVQLIGQRTGYEHLERLRREGRGAVIVTAHLGLFELGGLLMGHSGFPSVVLTLPEPSSSLTEWRARVRRAWNVDTIEVGPDRFAFLEIARRLREGSFVAALIDRPNTPEPVEVSLPGGTARFSTGILLVAEQCRVPLVPATMVRQANGTYRAEVFAPIEIVSRSSRAETLRFYSQQIADTLAPTLCAHPEQWFQFVPLS